MKGINGLFRLLHYIRPYKKSFIGSLILITILSVFSNMPTFIIGLSINELSRNFTDMISGVPGAGVNFTYLIYVIVALLVISLINQLSSYFANILMTNVVQNSMKDMRQDINQKINKLPVSYFDQNQQGNILSRITNDVDAIANAMQQSFVQIVNAVLSILTTVVMMFLLSVPMACVAIFIIPASIWLSKFIIKRSQNYFLNQQSALADLNGNVQEKYTGFPVIKLYNQEEKTIEEFKKINHNLAKQGFKAGFMSSIINPLVSNIVNIAYIGMALMGSYYVIGGSMEIGALQAFIQYIWLVNQPLTQITQLTGAMQSAGAAAIRVFEILDEKEETPDVEHSMLPNNMKGNVRFEKVCFSYTKKKPLIENVSFYVKSGQTVAIVGPTGAGKTTLINLLMRFYDVDSGKITIDGVSTMDMKRSEVRSLFGMVLQDAWLYHASIQENIRFGKLDATEYEITDAAKAANVHHFIKTMPRGYKMVLNKEANNVSLGEKQLLTIARAIISDPKILILDEATSSVDTRLEMLIQKTMKQIMKGRTSFVIAHRLSTIRDADLILVMKDGNIIEYGTHVSLLGKDGFYKELYYSQFANN